MKKLIFLIGLSTAITFLLPISSYAQTNPSVDVIKTKQNWEKAWPEDPDAQNHKLFDLLFLNNNISFAGTCNVQFGELTVFKKIGDNKWTPSGNGLPPSTGYSCTHIIADKFGNLFANVEAGLDYHQVYGIYKSTDQGASWKHMAFPNASVYAFAYDEKNNVLYASIGDRINNGIYKSKDAGVTWESTHQPLDAEDSVTTLKVDQEGNLYVGTHIYGLFILNNKTQTWTHYRSADIGSISQIIIKDHIIYVATLDFSHGSVFKSTDGGKTWVQAGMGLPSSNMIGDMIMDIQGNLYVGFLQNHPGASIYRLAVGSNHWELFNEGRTESTVANFFLDSKNNTIYEIDPGQMTINKYKSRSKVND